MTNIRQKAIEGLQVGDRFVISRTFSLQDIEQFAQLSKDHHPVHHDLPYIDLKGFKGPIAHGLLTACLITEIGGQIGWLAASMNFRFRRPVYPGEVMVCEWVITEINERGRGRAEVKISNALGEVVLEAETTGVIPSTLERERLKALLD